ncbi:galactosyl transferase [Tanacetum coccineum]
MTGGWGKLPAIRAALVAHPEAEWIWWLDEDTVITDMEYRIPFHKYKDYNFVVHGWPKEVYEKKRWLGLNDGSFLIRNCQWSLDFLDTWADMGPRSPNFDKWTKFLLEEFKHGPTDQTALAYLLWKEHDTTRFGLYRDSSTTSSVCELLKNIERRLDNLFDKLD